MSEAWSEPIALRGKRVMVTGAHGFLGRWVVEALRARGAEPLAIGRAECDLTDRRAVEQTFARSAPDLVLHAAAVGGGIGWMQAHPATSFSANILVNTHVLDAAQAAGVRRLVGVSSACAYARDAAQPMEEGHILEGRPEPTNGPYGWAKRAMLVHGRALAEETGFDCAFAVPTNLYGPGESFDPVRAHVVGALVRRFVVAHDGLAPEVVCWGTGSATRDLLHVRDAAEGLVRLLECGGGPDPVNLGSGEEHSVAKLAAAIAVATGYEGNVRWDREKPDGMLRKVLNTSRMYARTGWVPRVNLQAGIQETVACFRSSS